MAGNIKFWEIRKREEYWLPGQCRWMWRGSWWEKFKHIFVSLELEVGHRYVHSGHTYVQAGWMPIHSGHTYVQAGWTGVRPAWTLSCPTWFISSILSEKEFIFLKDISQLESPINSLIFGSFIFLKFIDMTARLDTRLSRLDRRLSFGQ